VNGGKGIFFPRKRHQCLLLRVVTLRAVCKTTQDGVIKLADFGISAVVRSASDSKSGDGPVETVEGSPFWMAPEVISMEGLGTSADVWSLGCTIIELLNGVPPYFDTNAVTAMFRMVEDDHPPLPDEDDSSDLCRVFLLECFQKDPDKRPTCDALKRHPWLKANEREKISDYTGTLSRVKQFNSKRRKATMKSMSIVNFFDAPAGEEETSPSSTPAEGEGEDGPPGVPSRGPPSRRRRRRAEKLDDVAVDLEQTEPQPEPKREQGAGEATAEKAVTPSNGRGLRRVPSRSEDPQAEHDWQYTALVSAATSRRNFVYAYTVFQVKVCVTYPKDRASVWTVERSFGDFQDFDEHLRAALRGGKDGAPRRSSQAISKSALVGLPDEGGSFVVDSGQGRVRMTGVALDELPMMPSMKFFGKTDQAYIEKIREQLNDYLSGVLQLPYACKHPNLLQFLDCSEDGFELE
jgi:Protein kinase domain/PX domain